MLSQNQTICRSELFTVFTNVLRCTVCQFPLIFQRVEGGTYGFYGFFGYTPLYIDYIFFQKMPEIDDALARA